MMREKQNKYGISTGGMLMYELLFTPMKIGTLEIKNRFVMPAMNSHWGREDHYFTDQALNYYGERAKGGFGLLITEFLCVSEEGIADKTQAGIYDDCFIPMLSSLTARVHENGARIFAQLQHSGRMQGYGTSEFPAVGASWIPAAGHPLEVHELTTEEIPGIIDKFVQAALRAKKAGFDGVEIHGAHGYLLAQFMSKAVNKRVDQYGGSTSNRARIVCEIIKAVKAACGETFPVSVRTSGDEGFEGGNTIEDAAAQALLFEEAGADVLNISYGVPIRSYYANAGFNMENVKKIKDIVSVPVIGVGRINDPALALKAVKSGSSDFVALGRQSVCDSHFPEKVKEGRFEEIFTCTGCMQRCLYPNSFEEGFGISCLVNPFSGKEGLWEIGEVENKKHIMIAGAGPAGLQAAWILAKRGHDVTIFEKEYTAGGAYRLASVPSMKQELAKTISTYLAFCKKYGVRIEYGKEVTKQLVDESDCGILIDATGSVPVVPPIEGIKGENVCLAQDILTCRKGYENKRVLVLGAGLVGVETAEFLTDYHNEVTLVDMLDKIAPLAPLRVRLDLVQRVKERKIRLILESRVMRILEDGIVYVKEGNEMTLSGYDAIVLAFGSKPSRAIEWQPEKAVVFRIGDASKAGDAKKAIFEATKLAIGL